MKETSEKAGSFGLQLIGFCLVLVLVLAGMVCWHFLFVFKFVF